MTDSSNTGNEDHSYRTQLRQALGVVSRSARHSVGGQTERLGGFGDEFAKAFVGGRTFTDIKRIELELGTGVTADR